MALYKEAPAARINNVTNNELPVDQAVPIGTKLQLRARISPESAWKYVKLMEVTVSPDPDDPHMSGSVALVKDGFVLTSQLYIYLFTYVFMIYLNWNYFIIRIK